MGGVWDGRICLHSRHTPAGADDLGVAVLVGQSGHERGAEFGRVGGERMPSGTRSMASRGRTADLLLTRFSLGDGGRREVGNLGNMGEGIGEQADSSPCCDKRRAGRARTGVDWSWGHVLLDLSRVASLYRAAECRYHSASCKKLKMPLLVRGPWLGAIDWWKLAKGQRFVHSKFRAAAVADET